MCRAVIADGFSLLVWLCFGLFLWHVRGAMSIGWFRTSATADEWSFALLRWGRLLVDIRMDETGTLMGSTDAGLWLGRWMGGGGIGTIRECVCAIHGDTQ